LSFDDDTQSTFEDAASEEQAITFLTECGAIDRADIMPGVKLAAIYTGEGIKFLPILGTLSPG